MAVSVDTTRGFTRGVAKPLFAANLRRANIAQYDVTADGKNLIVCAASGDWPFVPLSAVHNWTGRLTSEAR